MQGRDMQQPRPAGQSIEIDPYGCPYCGGPIVTGPPRCIHCGRSVELRMRRKSGGAALRWLVVYLLVLGITSALQGLYLTQMVSSGPPPKWLDQTLFKLVIGPAFFNPDGIGDRLTEVIALLTRVHYVLAALAALTATGLALKSRLVYFASFFLLVLLAAAPAAELLTGLLGWVSGIVILGLLIFAAAWLADLAHAFEWQTRAYNADLDSGPKTHVDYYNRGQHYAQIEMWAKAAAHLRVATQLAPRQALYQATLANAYAHLKRPAAARAAAGRALALAPDDGTVHALLNSLAESEESS
jgi:tetratricopeptide (TPR) repeat protein